MTRGSEPPDWALPGWDAVTDDDAGRRPTRGRATPGGPPATTSPPTPTVAAGQPGVRILGVSDVTRVIRGAIRDDPRLVDLWVEGEIGRVTVSSAGHAYFALKDARNQLQGVWFRDDRLRSAFDAKAGLRVVVHGRVDLYEPTGALQLYVDSIQPAGFGDLALRFEALKARLTAEGLFDAARKRPLPIRPTTIAVVTSPSGAVWRDICTVLERRWPLVRVVLVAARVQGDDAPASIVTALRRVERWIGQCAASGTLDLAPTVTIVARGGGSMEDLWAFNDERVVRAVVGHPLPIVSGIGHEVDVTLTDFAADVRAPTPSAAAELVVPDQAELLNALLGAGRRLDGTMARHVGAAARELAAERRVLERLHPAAQLAASRERAGLLLDRATRALDGRLASDRRSVERLAARARPTIPARVARERTRLRGIPPLSALAARRVADASGTLSTVGAALAVLGPQATLDRGYAIVRRSANGAIVRTPGQAPGGTPLRLRVAGGELPATADDR
ncbi:MAG: exodeoxyribonuclease VII large subunit [Candidatus Limnocylindrales bacterium]